MIIRFIANIATKVRLFYVITKELLAFFRKPTCPSLNRLREGPPLISVFFNSLYDPFGSPCRGQKRRSEPLRYMDGGPSEVYASSRAADFCAGMNQPC